MKPFTILAVVAWLACTSIDGGPSFDSTDAIHRRLENYLNEEVEPLSEEKSGHSGQSNLDMDWCFEPMRRRLLGTYGRSARLEEDVDTCAPELERELEKSFKHWLMNDTNVMALVSYQIPGFETLKVDPFSPAAGIKDLEPELCSLAFDQGTDMLKPSLLAKMVMDLGQNDPDTRQNFQRALDQYTLEPCAKLRLMAGGYTSLGRLYAGMKRDPMDFIANRSALFKRLTWTDKLCKMIQDTSRQYLAAASLKLAQTNA